DHFSDGPFPRLLRGVLWGLRADVLPKDLSSYRDHTHHFVRSSLGRIVMGFHQGRRGRRGRSPHWGLHWGFSPLLSLNDPAGHLPFFVPIFRHGSGFRRVKGPSMNFLIPNTCSFS